MFYVAGGMSATIATFETYIKESEESQGSIGTICYTYDDAQMPLVMLQVECQPTLPHLRPISRSLRRAKAVL